MSYLILQIVLCLGAAALLGVGFGWVLARRDLDAKVQEERDLRSAAVADWQSRHQEAVNLGDAARNRISALETDLDALRRDLQDKAERAAQVEGRIERGAEEVRRLQEAAAGHSAEKDAVIAQLQKGLTEREGELAKVRERMGELEAQLAVRSEAVERCSDECDRLRAENAALHGRHRKMEPKPAEQPSPPSLFAAAPVKDDLKKISGVGPKLERLLNQMQIFNFRQIASWSEQEIDSVQAKLHEFPGRIRRDDWVAGAKREHRKKYGEEI